MNWQAIRFDWNHIRAFLATAEEGSLSAAAKVLRQTQPTIGRQVAGLEADLGVLLFDRAGRRMVLTAVGQDLLAHVRAMGDAAAAISLTATGQVQELSGQVSITSTHSMAAFTLPKVIQHLSEVAPNLRIEVIAANDLRDLRLREADIALRHVQPTQPELIAKKVGSLSAGVYGTHAYFKRFGRPETIADMAGHRLAGFGNPEETVAELGKRGIHLPESTIHCFSNDFIFMIEYARNGVGLSIIDGSTARLFPELEQVLIEEVKLDFPLWLTTHQELHTSRRIRVVYDVLSEMLPQLCSFVR